jgi:AraC-like DNA-binding protein
MNPFAQIRIDGKAYVFFWKANFLYIGKGLQTAIHDHHAIQLIINLEGTFEFRSATWASRCVKAVLIDSDKPHECLTNQDTMLILNLAPESPLGVNLKTTYLIEQGYREMDGAATAAFIENLPPLLTQDAEKRAIVDFIEGYLFDLAGLARPEPLDERIIKVLNLLQANDGDRIRIREIAAKVFTSESRLIHLFKQNVGVPIRKYLLWLRLIKAIQHTFKDNNISQAALEAGFSDASHFNRTLKRMFGLNLNQEQVMRGELAGVNKDFEESLETYHKIRAYAAAHPTIYLPTHDANSGSRLAGRIFLR